MTTKNITLKAWLENNETVSVYQGEVNSRFLHISLIDNNGAVNLENKTVQFYAKKPDGTIIFNNAEIIDKSNGIVNVMLTSQMSAVDGVLSNCEIRVNDQDGATLKFKGINIIIIKTLPDTEIESSSEFTTLQEIMLKTIDMVNHQASTNNPHKVTAEQVGALPNTTKLPSKVSDLENDTGFITEYTETDPTVPSWAKAESKPSYDFSEINNKPTTIAGYGITDAISADHTHAEATTTKSGFLSKGDKSKLEKIEITDNNYLKVTSFAIGTNSDLTVATASLSVGNRNTVSAANSMSVGFNCTCSGSFALSAGHSSTASGSKSIAIGDQSHASENNAIAIGYHTTAKSYNFACGRYNSSSAASASGTSGDMFIVGNGSSSEAKNAFRVAASGSVFANSEYNSTGADYAELFEWSDSNINNDDRRGLFVTLDGDKIRLANSQDTYILGVISGNPSIVGDNFDDDWCNKYLTDIFGTPILENKSFPAVTDENGNTIQEAYEDKCFVLNPSYDPTQTYIPRSKRKEWDIVGLVGKLIIVDDGTCEVNRYCYPSQNGIATNSINKTNYRVMKRIDNSHIQVFIK